MSHIKINHALTFLCFIFLSSLSNAQENETTESRYKGINTGHETRVLDSKINTKNYKLLVSLPDNYHKSKNKKYPVLYLLDGQWDFTNTVSTHNTLMYDGLAPKIIIIGISYAGESPNFTNLRANDMTPTVLPQIKNSGEAKLFTEVLGKEIIPFVEKEYRASNKNRTLIGNSFGGLYTHYVLFNSPDLFHNYVICNPSLWYDNELSFKYENKYYKNNKTLNANATLVWGSLDDIKRHEKMANQIKTHNYKGLNFYTSTEEGFGHNSTKPGGYAKGILHSFKIKGIDVPEKELKKYTGNYELAPGQEISLIIHEGHLAVKEFNGKKNIPIYSISENEFSLMGTYRIFEFNKDEKGKIISLTVETDPGNTIVLKKVK